MAVLFTPGEGRATGRHVLFITKTASHNTLPLPFLRTQVFPYNSSFPAVNERRRIPENLEHWLLGGEGPYRLTLSKGCLFMLNSVSFTLPERPVIRRRCGGVGCSFPNLSWGDLLFERSDVKGTFVMLCGGCKTR